MLRLWRTHLRHRKKLTTGCKKTRAPREFFALGARRFCKTLKMRILTVKKICTNRLHLRKRRLELLSLAVIQQHTPTTNMTTTPTPYRIGRNGTGFLSNIRRRKDGTYSATITATGKAGQPL